MQSLANYSSSDEDNEDEKDSKHIQESFNETKNNFSKINPVTSKDITRPNPKVKKFDISILPKEIQEALTKGIEDSDDDDDFQILKKLNKKTSTIEENSRNINKGDYKNVKNTRSALLDLLPKPQNNVTTNEKSNLIKNTRKEYENKVETKIEKQFNNKIDNGDQMDSDNDKDYNDKSYDNLDDDINNYKSQIKIQPNVNYSYSIGKIVSNPTNTEISADMYNNNEMITDNNDYVNESEAFQYNNRKRDREIEQELLQGNTSVIDSLKTSVVSSKLHDWDQVEYNRQIELENELKSAYNVSSGPTLQPTKLQLRRHQINSLAVKAAEMELQLLDAKTNRLRTKSETQAKYGW